MKSSNLEHEIAYFFGANDQEKISKHFLKALNAQNDNDAIMHLCEAYQEVMSQTRLTFDVKKAAKLEFTLIKAHRDTKPFEEIVQIMIKLYETVFGTKSDSIINAAYLRTFLYMYKGLLESQLQSAPSKNIEFLKTIAKQSDFELSKAHQTTP